MNCSIVIRAYNEEKHIGRLLEGIRHQTLKDVEIILVDSGSTDGTVSVAESFGARIVHIRPEEFTFGRSLNYGIKAATREFIVIASAHVYPVYPDWLETLLRPFQDDSVALTYGKQRGPDFAKFSEQQIFHQWYPDVSKPKQETAFCNNANAAIRKSLWEKNNYDETLTAWKTWPGRSGQKSRDMPSRMSPKPRSSTSTTKRRAECTTVIAAKRWRCGKSIPKRISIFMIFCA